MAKHGDVTQHKAYAQTGKANMHSPAPAGGTTRNLSGGGFVSSNDRAFNGGGKQMGYSKTPKMKCRGP